MASILRNLDPSAELTNPSARPLAFRFDDLNDRASEYLESVRNEAAKIIQQAHEQSAQVRRQAEADGRAAADAAAARALDQKIGLRMVTVLPALEDLVVKVNEAKADWLRRWEQSALTVAAAIAKRLIRRELSQQPEISLEWIAEALQLAAGSVSIQLHLNPVDHQHLGAQVEKLASTMCQITEADIISNPDVTAGGCRVETKFGEIDQQIEAQLDRIQAELN